MRLATAWKVIEKNIIINNYWEKENSDLLLQQVQNGEIFLDIGANIWRYTLLVASKLNATGHVFAFEPAKRNNDYLEQNVELNHFSNVTLVNKAVWAYSWYIDLHVNYEDPWKTTFLNNYQEQTNAELVEVIVLDEYFWIDQKIDHIKIDVEWYEYEVIQWMKRILSQNDTIKLYFEYSPVFYDKLNKSTSRDLLIFLWKLWFNFFFIEKGELKKCWTVDEIYTFVMSERDGQCDLIASRSLNFK